MSKPKSNESKDEKTDQATSIDQQLVVASSVQPHIKHPLQSRWTLWYYISEKGKTWEDCQHRITSFATVEDFWSLIHHLQPPSELKSGSDYSLVNIRVIVHNILLLYELWGSVLCKKSLLIKKRTFFP